LTIHPVGAASVEDRDAVHFSQIRAWMGLTPGSRDRSAVRIGADEDLVRRLVHDEALPLERTA
jgi:hypothetical protein